MQSYYRMLGAKAVSYVYKHMATATHLSFFGLKIPFKKDQPSVEVVPYKPAVVWTKCQFYFTRLATIPNNHLHYFHSYASYANYMVVIIQVYTPNLVFRINNCIFLTARQFTSLEKYVK